MPKAATPCCMPGIPSASLSTITIHTDTVGLRASDLDIIKIKIHSSCCEIEDFVETHLCKLCVILPSRVSYYGIMHVVGSVPACPSLRREHAAKIGPSLCWPWMLG